MKSAWVPLLLIAMSPVSAVAAFPADQLAQKYGVPVSEVRQLRGRGLGEGGIKAALAISRKSWAPIGDVMMLRDSGMSWSQIARHYGFELSDAVSRARDGDASAYADRGLTRP
jgi:hypothetical protein